MLASLPTLAALESDDEVRLASELRLGSLRSQLAVIRTLADHVEHLTRPQDADGVREQLGHEMARLGCRVLEVAASLTGLPHPDESGVFTRI